ncbi:nucleotidyltransferase family protein [bacterium]|nr:nucleotidyltransferase family protein [bacterium]
MSEQTVAAIILAAGASSRLGRPKQLLDWFGKPFIKQLIEIAHRAKLDPVIVVSGSGHEEVENAIQDDDVTIVYNQEWQKGQSSSMQAGCKALMGKEAKSFIIFLCDQPQVPVELVERMIAESKRDDLDIVATSVQGKICPPTLFKTKCIEGIMTLHGDQGGRALFNSYRTQILDWQDARLLQDSDTEEDYYKLKSLYAK